ncbi:hypothetical protein QJ850_gp067 [Acanthamoeba polyphaga mimivirus]|uniref:Uncharacterized protein n=1 Tax=Acanthamoeba polyphaga mimivirus Kroon TaxID=3069720 RepID=A0A0G2Y9V9_9VIRU|nr:hypothetical protein QJ850_gp067 [Acanthamoeba polyphaga mimivirus]AKI80632.1 hypothetical protein [Acanthamoeba polyphaga mimivirus Kroon]
MKLKDFIDFSSILKLSYNDFLPLDDNHKSYTYEDNIPLQDDSETRFLIQRAKDSFLSHTKIKDKYIKSKCKWDECEYSCNFYLSSNRKFYCVYFSYYMDFTILYFYGIIERKTGKHLIISYEEDRYNVYPTMNHHMFNYEWDYQEHEDLHYPPYKHEDDPLELICCLEDQFNVFYKEMCDKNTNNDSDSE